MERIGASSEPEERLPDAIVRLASKGSLLHHRLDGIDAEKRYGEKVRTRLSLDRASERNGTYAVEARYGQSDRACQILAIEDSMMR